MKKLITALAPTVLAYAWKNRDSIRQWIAERRAGAPMAGSTSVTTPGAVANPSMTTA